MPGFFVAGWGGAGSVAFTGRQLLSSVHTRRLFLLLGLLLPVAGLFAAKGEPYPGLGRKWHYYQSANFELYSANSDRDSRNVLEKMELMLAVFVQEFNLRTCIPRRVTLYYFDNQEEFQAYAPPGLTKTTGFSGYSFVYGDKSILTMAPMGSRRWASEIAYRQCVRIIFQLSDETPPDWYLIGLGGLMSTLRENGDELVLGGKVSEHVEVIDRFGLDPIWQTFARDPWEVKALSPGQRILYDATCWVTMHYLFYGSKTLPPDQRTRLLRTAQMEVSHNRPRSFEKSVRTQLAPDQPDLTAALARYVKNGKFATQRIVRPALPAASSYVQRDVTREEMLMQLAELGFRSNQASAGRSKLNEAFEHAPTLQLYELFGAVAVNEDNSGKVKDYWRKAFELGTANPRILNELCRIEGGIVFRSLNLEYRIPTENADRLRELLLRSIAVAPDQNTAYRMLLWVEAYALVPRRDNVELATKHLETRKGDGSAVLAQALERYHQKDDAGTLLLLEQIKEDEYPTMVVASAEILRASVEKRSPSQEVLSRRANRE